LPADAAGVFSLRGITFGSFPRIIEMAQGKVVLITTGGTISSVDSGKGAVPKSSGTELLERLGAAPEAVNVEVIEFSKIPGCEMTPARMAELSALAAQHLTRDEVAGVVVTHGTDTIEESAFFCHLTLASDKPAVFVGSMRTGSDLSWDGPRNLLDGLKVARWDRARGIGATLVMNEEIHSARFVTKGNGLTLATFHSPACGPLGHIYNGEPMLLTRPALERRVVAPTIESKVAMVTALSGEAHALIEALTRRGVRGLVIAGFGSGRAPLSWVKPLEAAVKNGLPVVLASRTGAGAIDDPYGYGGAHYLRQAGLIAAHEMPAHKARIKLMLALGNGMTGAALKQFFENE
jgi:L-asparaginase